MLLLEILLTWIFTTTPAALQVPPHHPESSLLLARMDQLESLVADHQAQFQRERHQRHKEKQILQRECDQWEKEKQLLLVDVHTLRRENQEMRREMVALQNSQTLLTQTLMEALQDKQTVTQTLTAENQGLKAQLGDLQRQLVSTDSSKQQVLQQDQGARCEGKASGPGTAGDEQLGEEVRHTPGEQSGQAVDPSQLQGHSQQMKLPSPQHLRDSVPAQHLGDSESFKQHVQAARSDDGGPWEAVTSHLAQQTTQLAADIQALKNADVQQRQDIQAARRSTFIHWGSATCASGSSELVYSGIVGGSEHTHSGAAANALCLTLSPRLQSKSLPRSALLYGAEYETYESHDDMDAVCAVCRSLHPTTITVPGTDVCAAGWTRQYSGFLMAGYHDHTAASQFICVDSKFESAMGSKDDRDGHLLYYTKTRCGSLPCPPYENDRVVTCAVCSK